MPVPSGTKKALDPGKASFEVERESQFEARRLIKVCENAISTRRYGGKPINEKEISSELFKTFSDNGLKDRSPIDGTNLVEDSRSDQDAEVFCARTRFDRFLEITGLGQWIAEGLEDAARDDKFDAPASVDEFFDAYFLSSRRVTQELENIRSELCALLAEKARLRDDNAKLRSFRQEALLSRKSDEEAPEDTSPPDRKIPPENTVQAKTPVEDQIPASDPTNNDASQNEIVIADTDEQDYRWAEEEYGFDEYSIFYDDKVFDGELHYDAEAEEAKRKAAAAAAALDQAAREAKTPADEAADSAGGQTLGAGLGKASTLDLKIARKAYSANKDARTPVKSAKGPKMAISPDR